MLPDYIITKLLFVPDYLVNNMPNYHDTNYLVTECHGTDLFVTILYGLPGH